MSFSKQSFNRRFATMGDPAEAAFDLVYPKHHKLGLNRPPFYMGGMTQAMRYTPDRMLRDRFVECMGIGRDRTLKIKDEKIEALQDWLRLGAVSLFVYDQSTDTYYEAPIDDWVSNLRAYASDDTFPEGKTYKALRSDRFPTTPTPLPQ